MFITKFIYSYLYLKPYHTVFLKIIKGRIQEEKGREKEQREGKIKIHANTRSKLAQTPHLL